jgi:protein-L-isoaspartate(D-aspartate) O-methyltransferase
MSEPDFTTLHQRMLAEIAAKTIFSTTHLGKAALDGRVMEALAKVPRHLFVPIELRPYAYVDTPLPIGYGKTISQPFIVALMTDLLELREEDRVLEIGTGLGYQAAVLAELAGEVHSIERIPELAARAREALREAGYDERVVVHIGDGTLGDSAHAPFDAIAVAAGAPRIPDALVDQLVLGGRLVVPVGGSTDQQLEQVVRTEEGQDVRRSVPCRFVPLVGEQGW